MKCTICNTDIFGDLKGHLWERYGHFQADYARVQYYCPNCKGELEIDLTWRPSVLKRAVIVYSNERKQ